MIKTKPRLLWVLIITLSYDIPAYAHGISSPSQKSLKLIARNTPPVTWLAIEQNAVNKSTNNNKSNNKINNKSTTSNKIYRQTPVKKGRDLYQVKDIIVTAAQKTADEKGYDEVFSKNVSNVYIGKEYLERFRIDSSGEVLKGLSGVYNMNTRVASAITPNIRGVTGKGRVPLTIDGTEQTVDVWLNNYGIGDRNYVDPYLFRSIAVEKSPALTRGMKTGVGGGVAIKTIEPTDVIPEGKKWGIGFKVETAGNTVNPATDFNQYLYTPDYRDITGAVSGNSNDVNLPINLEILNKSHKDVLNFKDNSALLTLGFKTQLTDGLAAYSYRKKGNYFTGKRGITKYQNNHFPLDEEGLDITKGSYIPNMAKLIKAHDEVMNTSTNTKTLLLKNNWYLPNEQKITLQHARMRSTFAEISPLWASFLHGFREETPESEEMGLPNQIQRLRSHTNSDTYKISYAWKPLDSRWINLESNLWKHKSDSERYQNGGADFFVAERDTRYDYWVWCNYYGRVPNDEDSSVCDEMIKLKQVPKKKPKKADGYTIYPGSQQTLTSTRYGFDISNRFNWSNNFNMTLAADIQREKLKEYSFLNEHLDWIVVPAVQGATKYAGPRTGRRNEWGGNISFNWQATDKLNIVAGLRYHKFVAFDDELTKQRQQRNPMFSKGPQLIGYNLNYQQLATDEEAELARIRYTGPSSQREPAHMKLMAIADNKYKIADEDIEIIGEGSDDNKVYYWIGLKNFVSLKNNKLSAADNIFYNGQANIKEMVDNPQGLKGSYRKYKRSNEDYADSAYSSTMETDDVIVERDEEDDYALPDPIGGHAWAPMIAISYDIVANGRLFGRYAQATRFPSVYEISTSTYNPIHNIFEPVQLKPERSRNWEVGYAHNFSSYLQGAKADARITYYYNNIKDLIENPWASGLMQFDKKIHSGIEFLARFDNSRYFTNLGVTYRLQQKMCDKSYGMGYDWFNVNQRFECIQGGFGSTKSFNSMQPKYSINLDLGTRRFNDKLELGTRAIYHGPIANQQMDKLSNEGLGEATKSASIPYYWHPAWVIDVYGRYNVNKDIALKFSINNITDQYYLDPLSSVPLPAPGRSLSIGLEGKF